MKTEHELTAVNTNELLVIEGGDTKGHGTLSQGTQDMLDKLAAAVAEFVKMLKSK